MTLTRIDAVLPGIALAALAASSTLAAQLVSPADRASRPGGLFHYTAPLGGYQRCVVQQVHKDLRGVPCTIRGLAFRRALPVASARAHRIEATIRVGRARLGTFGGRFADNFAAAPVVVAARQWFELPDWTRSPSSHPAPFDAVLAFDQPYVHDGRGGLVWEIRVHDHDQADPHGRAPNFIVDAFTGEEFADGGEEFWGASCQVAGEPAPMVQSFRVRTDQSGTWRADGRVRFVRDDQPSWLLLGVGRSMRPLRGMCGPLLVDGVFAAVPGVFEHGRSRMQLQAPFQPGLEGSEITAQVVTVDPLGAGLGLALSHGAASRLVAPPPPPPPVGMVVARFDDAATEGRATVSQGLVVQFR